MSTFIKKYSSLKRWCFEMPSDPYSQRHKQAKKDNTNERNEIESCKFDT